MDSDTLNCFKLVQRSPIKFFKTHSNKMDSDTLNCFKLVQRSPIKSKKKKKFYRSNVFIFLDPKQEGSWEPEGYSSY